MDTKTVANKIKTIVDNYWANEISKGDAEKIIKEMMEDRECRIKVYRGEDQTAVFKKIMGVRRLSTFDELYKKNMET